jgi:hypothetical protein
LAAVVSVAALELEYESLTARRVEVTLRHR